MRSCIQDCIQVYNEHRIVDDLLNEYHMESPCPFENVARWMCSGSVGGNPVLPDSP